MKKYYSKYRFKYNWNCKCYKNMFKRKIKLIYFSTNYVYPGKKEIIQKPTHYTLLIIMLGQN